MSTAHRYRVADRAASLLLFMTVACVVVPFLPAMPSAGLDHSWQFGLNQAVAQGLHIGSDIVFTFGPYASVYTAMYHPATDALMVASSAFLAIDFCIVLGYVLRDRDWRFRLGAAFMFAGLVTTRDALLFAYLPLLTLLSFDLVDSPRTENTYVAYRDNKAWVVVVTYASLGLLPLVKGTLSVLCIAQIVVTFCWFIVHRRYLLALLGVAVPASALLLFWTVAGQPLAYLPAFFVNMSPVVAGYAEAMGNDGRFSSIAVYLLAAGVLVLALLRRLRKDVLAMMFVGSLYALILFITFKFSFTRRDEGHTATASAMLLICSLAAFGRFPGRETMVALCVSALVAVVIQRDDPARLQVVRNVATLVWSTFGGLEARVGFEPTLPEQYRRAVAKIASNDPLPLLDGTSDIYSTDQAALIASGNHWAPRPVFQSYSAYEPALEEMNRLHLVRSDAPTNIFFSLDPIDGRLGSLDDGASWPELLTRYDLDGVTERYVLLRRKPGTVSAPDLRMVDTVSAAFDRPVRLPHAKGAVFARTDLKVSALGRLAVLLYKPPTVRILIRCSDGSDRDYRFVPSMAKSNFLIAPLVTSAREFADLFSGGTAEDRCTPVSFKLMQPSSPFMFWSPDFAVTFSVLAD